MGHVASQTLQHSCSPCGHQVYMHFYDFAAYSIGVRLLDRYLRAPSCCKATEYAVGKMAHATSHVLSLPTPLFWPIDRTHFRFRYPFWE